MKKIFNLLFRNTQDAVDADSLEAKELLTVASTVLDLQIQSSANLELRVSHLEEKIDKLTEAVSNLNFAISHLIEAANAQLALLSTFAGDEQLQDFSEPEAEPNSSLPKKDKGTLN